MSIRRMTLGTGYRYLMSSVARADEATKATGLARYYTVSGTPPGRVLGAGLAGLNDGAGVQAGTVVTEQHLFRMLGMLQDPVTGGQLGRSPRVDAVAGFDLTFSAPKSVSVAWALADPATQEAILTAHRQALRRVIRYAEEQVLSSRIGKNGALQADVLGVVAAAFDHWDSRSGDPQLHTHVVVLNRVQTPDGKWRTLDSRGLFKAAVALSELYNGVLTDYLTASLGWGWEPTRRRHSEIPKWEVTGVPQELQVEFSTRSKAIEASKNDLVERFVQAHGRHPSSAEVLQLRQQATLTTRPGKTLHSLAELTRDWRARAQKNLGDDLSSWARGLRDRNRSPLLHKESVDQPALDQVAADALAEVSDKRATFTRSNILAETLRHLHATRFQSADDRIAVAEGVTALALNQALLLSPPEPDVVPVGLQRPDGSSRLHARDSQIYTTHEILDAETRLLETSRITTGPRLQLAVIDTSGENAVVLSADQATAVQKIAISGRPLDVLIGAAGTGKSTTMSGLRTVWEREHGPRSVIGLAPSASAAEVLAVELGIQTENTAKWLTELTLRPRKIAELDALKNRLQQQRHPIGRRHIQKQIDTINDRLALTSLRPGSLVIIDEASLAGTITLDTITQHAQANGAKVLLVGDFAQLGSVNAGGAFRLLATDRDDVPELTDVRRFHHDWEKEASVQLRDGNPAALIAYDDNNRITGGDREHILDQMLHAWNVDRDAGLRTIMIAADNDTVDDLNHRARELRVLASEIESAGVQLLSGTKVGVGDLITTRRNDRTLKSSVGWVRNGDQWTVTHIGDDGSLTVNNHRNATETTLPADYVRAHIELGYATNAHRTQGETFDTAHAYIAPTTRRELLYVMTTRGRHTNNLYIDTTHDTDAETNHAPLGERSPLNILAGVMTNADADLSATEIHRRVRHGAEPPGVWQDFGSKTTTRAIEQHASHNKAIISSI